jgi:hypothetical protein
LPKSDRVFPDENNRRTLVSKRPPAKPARPAKKAPAKLDTVALIDCGSGDLFELVEHPKPGVYTVNRSIKPKKLPSGKFSITEWVCLVSGLARLSDAFRAMADEIDRVDQR